MFLTLLSMLAGGALRLLPEVFHLLNKKTDNEHELAMLDKQLQLETLKSDAAKAVAATQAEASEAVAQTQADAATDEADTRAASDALARQMQLLGEHFQSIGNKWIDGFNALARTCVDVLNMLVRPATTYYFLAMYGLYKLALMEVALQQADMWHAVLQVWTVDDANMLAGILAFWFVGRVFDKRQA